MGKVYDLVNTARAKFRGSRLVLSGVLRSKGMTWRPVGEVNDSLEATFVDPSRWIRDLDFGRDGFHLNRNGARELGDLYSSLWNRRRK